MTHHAKSVAVMGGDVIGFGRSEEDTMEYYTSASWVVREGKEDEFVAGWRDWIEWTRDNVRGLISARLVRDTREPRHFISLAQWEDASVRAARVRCHPLTGRWGCGTLLCHPDDDSRSDGRRVWPPGHSLAGPSGPRQRSPAPRPSWTSGAR